MKTNFLIGLLFSLLLFSGITVSADSDGTYVYSVSNNVATITGVADKATFTGSQTIPEKIGDYTVTAISSSAFKDCTGLTSITVPDSITTIGSSAFSGCSALEEMTLPFIGASRTAGSSDGLFGYIFGTSSYTGGIETTQYYYSSSSYNRVHYIPSALKKVTVTDASQLSYGAFYNCTN
ncbi:MAG: leucine-rich repeat protein, partial [Clostridia bacterium]|nr:leucine-rich repeat protein [Clostridia bacterium]